jgi:ADP-ribose pyrophosphatase YjhB (NUDIX family)
MGRVLHGNRIGREATLAPAANGAVLDESGTKLLLVQRKGTGKWQLPGGHMEPGESIEEACSREVREEIGLEVEPTSLVGVYSSPDEVMEYPDGTRNQGVTLLFRCCVTGGERRPGEETSDSGYFTREEIERLPLMGDQPQRIADIFADRTEAVLR